MTVKNEVFSEQPGRSSCGKRRDRRGAGSRGQGWDWQLAGRQVIILLGKPRLLFSASLLNNSESSAVQKRLR